MVRTSRGVAEWCSEPDATASGPLPHLSILATLAGTRGETSAQLGNPQLSTAASELILLGNGRAKLAQVGGSDTPASDDLRSRVGSSAPERRFACGRDSGVVLALADCQLETAHATDELGNRGARVTRHRLSHL